MGCGGRGKRGSRKRVGVGWGCGGQRVRKKNGDSLLVPSITIVADSTGNC